MNKCSIRRTLLNQRNAISPEMRLRHSAIICEKICQSPLWKKAQHIGIYYPVAKEVDVSSLFNRGKQIYLPATQNEDMQFHLFNESVPLHAGEYGIPQPTYLDQHTEPSLDICIVPLVGFDGQGNRLGMGAGFYDKYFGNLNNNTILIGAAYQIQNCLKLPADDWDVKLHHVFTEKMTYVYE